MLIVKWKHLNDISWYVSNILVQTEIFCNVYWYFYIFLGNRHCCKPGVFRVSDQLNLTTELTFSSIHLNSNLNLDTQNCQQDVGHDQMIRDGQNVRTTKEKLYTITLGFFFRSPPTFFNNNSISQHPLLQIKKNKINIDFV